jgi:hypothetical protein
MTTKPPCRRYLKEFYTKKKIKTTMRGWEETNLTR